MSKLASTDNPRELYDKVDKNDKIIGSVSRRDAHSKHIFHRAVHVWLFDLRGRVFLQQRSATKDTNPLKWGSSMGGHVDRGESYEAAAVRETAEELGLKVELDDLVFVQKFSPTAATNWEFVKLYFVAYGKARMGAVRVNKTESAAGRFFKVADVVEKIRKGRSVFTPDFVLFFEWADKAGLLG
ncbi:MAG: NUDIX domain-containing protein [Candidatus Micrarchaeota archaeon]